MDSITPDVSIGDHDDLAGQNLACRSLRVDKVRLPLTTARVLVGLVHLQDTDLSAGKPAGQAGAVG